MQAYICSNCKKKVPRSRLVDHRKECGGDLTEHSGIKGRLGKGFKTALWTLMTVLLAGLSLFLGRSSFHSLADMRELERVPPTTVRAVLNGEVNLNGITEMTDSSLRAPQTNTPCVYYRYLVEKKERDSDGDTRWVTERDEKKFVPFILRDETGGIRLIPDSGVDFSVEKSWSDRRGDRRYTEYRIDPGDSLFVFGYVVQHGGRFEVRFNQDGHYKPIISELGETRERMGMAGGSIAKAWFGLVTLALALSVVISVFRQHRLLVYFSILNFMVAVYLLVLGLNMMKLDLTAASERLKIYSETVKAETGSLLQSYGISWSGDWESLPAFDHYASRGLPVDARIRLREIRLNLARTVERVRTQRAAFPEFILAPLWGIPKPNPLPLPDALRNRMDQEGAGLEKARIPPLIGLILIAVSLLTGVVAFIFGFRKVKFKRCMENIPTSPSNGAVYGLSEFKGVVDLSESANLLRGPLSNQPCVQYHYKVEEKRGSGKKSKWVTLINERRRIPFLCRDGEGILLIDPAGAEIHTSNRRKRRMGRRRYTETWLGHGDPLYAIGECSLDPSRGDQLYMRKPDDKNHPFILSNLSEPQVMLRIARTGIFLLNVSFAGILLMALLLFGLSGSFAATDYLAAALAAPIFMTFVTLALHYNDLVFLRERTRRNWSNIDVSLKKRANLVPQIENIAQALMSHEKDLHEAVVNMRKLYSARVSRTPEGMKQYMEAEHASLQKLIMVAEDYPDLKSNQQTGLLMRTMIVMENEISLMRNGYNDAVETYNTRIQSFPDVLFARMFHFKEESLVFAETEITRVPPSIQNLWEKEQTPPPIEIENTEEEAEAVIEPDDQTPASPATLAAAGAQVEEPEPLEKETNTLIDEFLELLSQSPEDELAWFTKAETFYPQLREQTPAAYRRFKTMLFHAMEEDDVISVGEYALQKSISRHLDPVFGLTPQRPTRHTRYDTMLDSVSHLLSLLTMLEESAETRQTAFHTGVSNLNHQPASDFVFQECDPDNLAEFDQVLEDIAHATRMHRANVMYACEALVKMNNDASPKQILMLYAVADTLERKRPTGL